MLCVLRLWIKDKIKDIKPVVKWEQLSARAVSSLYKWRQYSAHTHTASLEEFPVPQTLISVYICNLIFLKSDKEFWKKTTASIFNYHPEESFQISATTVLVNHPTIQDTLK